MNDIDICNKVLKEYNGNLSIIYPLIKEEIENIDYPLEDIAFVGEFCCFEDDYAVIRLNMHKRKLEKYPVLDIGCQMGFQSIMFQECNYNGIDVYEYKFFRDKGNYKKETFPFINSSLNGKVVISNMSLGFFNNEELGITNESIVDKLKEASYLYISSSTVLCDMLKPYFSTIEVLKTNTRSMYPFYFMTNN